MKITTKITTDDLVNYFATAIVGCFLIIMMSGTVLAVVDTAKILMK